MSNKSGPYIFQTARQVAPSLNEDRSCSTGESRNAAFKFWLSQVSYMLDEWELDLMGHSAPQSTFEASFETIAAFKDVLKRS